MFKTLLFLIGFTVQLNAQEIFLFHTYYSNSIDQWVYRDHHEKELGYLNARWAFDQDYSQWDLRMGELSGTITLPWKDNPDQWEVRILNDLCLIRPVWPNYLDAWRIEYQGEQYTLRLQNDLEGYQWILSNGDQELLVVYNLYFEDLRDWALDYFTEIKDPMLPVVALFVSMKYSLGKELRK